jgi:hypothetical protein
MNQTTRPSSFQPLPKVGVASIIARTPARRAADRSRRQPCRGCAPELKSGSKISPANLWAMTHTLSLRNSGAIAPRCLGSLPTRIALPNNISGVIGQAKSSSAMEMLPAFLYDLFIFMSNCTRGSISKDRCARRDATSAMWSSADGEVHRVFRPFESQHRSPSSCSPNIWMPSAIRS